MPHNLHVVLVEPQIPLNTGSIGRTCLATETTLHLIEPLGFEITHARLTRAGLDYWPYLRVIRHKNLPAFLESIPEDAPKVLFSKKAGPTYFEHHFEPGSYLFFGSEARGLPDDLAKTYADRMYRIPQYDPRVRSLNLANVVSIVIYEAIRQLGP